MKAFSYLLQSVWALDEKILNTLAEIVVRHVEGVKLSQTEIEARVKASAPNGVKASEDYYVSKGVAVVPIYGVISKYSAGINSISQPEGTSVEQICEDLRAALEDDSVHCVLLDVESPGGTIDGLADLADEISAASKPVTAFANGQMCSAAYWLGCQAGEVVASQSALVGSIGIYTVVRDSSKVAESSGVKVSVVKAGAMKGAGVPGTPVTPEQLAESQRSVDAFYGMFVGAVAKGRGIPEDAARALGDGRVHIGATAVSQGLADRIDTFENTLARLQASVPQPARSGAKIKGVIAMKEDEVRAEIEKRNKDITAAFPNDPAYALQAIIGGKTLIEAQAGYVAVLQTRLAEKDAAHAAALQAKDNEIAQLKAAVPQTPEKTPPPAPGGIQPVQTTRTPAPVGGGTAKERFEALFLANLKACDGKRSKAMSKTVSENKALHEEMLAEAGPKAS